MTNFWYLDLIHKYIPPTSQAYPYYFVHVTLVTKKALEIARKLNLSQNKLKFIEEASMLHDIGICKVEDEDFGTSGGPYITHGLLGAEILGNVGYEKHAGVAKNHTGVCIYKEDIIRENLPLPKRDFIPETLEEEIISFADLYFRKNHNRLWKEQSIQEIRSQVAKHGEKKLEIFEKWLKKFG